MVCAGEGDGVGGDVEAVNGEVCCWEGGEEGVEEEDWVVMLVGYLRMGTKGSVPETAQRGHNSWRRRTRDAACAGAEVQYGEGAGEGLVLGDCSTMLVIVS